MQKRIAVLASGSGSNFQALIDAFSKSSGRITISGLIASKAGIKAIERAEKAKIPTLVLPSHKENREKFEQIMLNQLTDWKVDLVVLAGFLSLIPISIVNKWPNAIINIHPALLPKFGGIGMYGLNVHQAVIEANESLSGCSAHYVSEKYDEGDVIDQAFVDVLKNDTAETLAKKILIEEHKLLPKVVERILLP